MTRRITVDILGDAPLFSKHGKGYSYLATCGKSRYLVDCGANIFNALSPRELRALDGVFVTHVHSDHIRYLPDLALYLRFSGKKPKRLRIITTDQIHAQLRSCMAESLETTLDSHRRLPRQIPYEEFFETVAIGPRPLYHVALNERENGLKVVTASGRKVPPARAKAFVHPATGRISILFRDKKTGAWVEPGCFYDFSSEVFYEKSRRDYRDRRSGLRVCAVKGKIWHGMPTVGFSLHFGGSSVFFTGDTIADPGLLNDLATKVLPGRKTRLNQFAGASVVIDDIAGYIERVWSADRLLAHDNLPGNAVTFHDCGGGEHTVHTDYSHIENSFGTAPCGAGEPPLVLIHTPADIVSRFPVAMPGQRYVIEGCKITSPKKADYYIKEGELLTLAYEDPKGKHCIRSVTRNGFRRLVCEPYRKEGQPSAAFVRYVLRNLGVASKGT